MALEGMSTVLGVRTRTNPKFCNVLIVPTDTTDPKGTTAFQVLAVWRFHLLIEVTP